ncbi:MAG: response regulator [Chloroflexota bacterium]|nr:response regulator [Chloroflexota bacterium]
MENASQPPSGTEPDEDRLSRLSQASLRINSSLDVDTALRAVMESARSLTDASHAVIITLDASGRVDDRLVLGIDPGEVERMWQAPEGRQFFEYLNTLPGPLRAGPLEEFTASIGLANFRSPVSISAFLMAPILHRGVRSGNILVGSDDPGQEFSREDEETLVLFASQAAQVIANARQHREEQRARADLDTLIDTAPVGVVVLDVGTGLPRSLNREARRIVDGLRDPDQTPEMLLQVVTFRRANGQEVSLIDLPLSDLLISPETIRAEEIVLKVPDGRSVSVLLNATPIRTEAGAVESLVVTLQDMTAVEEAERLRTDFLAMVSHELRAPLTSIKGSAATVLGSVAELDTAVVRQFFRIIEDQADHMHRLVADLLDVARIEAGTLPVSPEPAEVAVLVDRAKNTFSSTQATHSLAINIEPDLPLVLADRRRIVQVLVNLLSNAARNSPDSSSIQVTAAQDGVHVAIAVADEGRGIPTESLPQLFGKYFGIQSEEQEDTGLGLAICKGIVEAHGGRIRAESDGPGLGARFTFTLPVAGGSTGRPEAEASSPPASRSTRRPEGQAAERVPVLAVDDDPEALRYISDTLSRSGYMPIVTGDPETVLSLLEDKKPGLVLLDLMLPGTDGLKLMDDVQAIADVPVIFLSAYGQEDLIVKAFDKGAADYVVKPFSQSELAARMRAALRKREVSEPPEPYVLGDLTIDYEERRVTLAGRLVELMAIEYRTLVELSANAGRVVTQRHLLQRIWGERSGGDVRPMRTIVSRLRRKLGDDASNPTYIFTEPRVGYRMPRGETREPEKQ